ncbi:MAG TPA: tetratricopeptide repeat protein [Devosia sp.]|jgi:hypothetical protein|nr:tetratricopeptide repeat protein [Devosia sp.]
MRAIRGKSLISVATAATIALSAMVLPVYAQTAADAALGMANMLDGAGGGVSGDDLLAALEDAANAGQPMAMWQLGTMYENGQGVARDPAKALSYFSKIADQNADAVLSSPEAAIIAQSFVKVGDYLKDGVPDAGIAANARLSYGALSHAATYFGDPEAQYRLGKLFISDEELGGSVLQGARWFMLAARKGHCPAQAHLGDLLFNGGEGMEAQPVEGLKWLAVSQRRCAGTADAAWVEELLNRAVSIATPEQRAEAFALAEGIAPQVAGF